MRLPHSLLLGLLVTAACSSRSPSVPDGGAVADAAVISDGAQITDGAGALSCGSTLAAYCGTTACQMTLDGAKQDHSLCPASLTPCGDYDLVTKTAVDTSTTYYYFQGNLLAVGHTLLPGKLTCLAGPSTFTPPTCTGMSQVLPACP